MTTTDQPKSSRHGLFLAGTLAGAAARVAVLPIDQGGAKGPVVAVVRRSLHFGLLFSIYIPLHQGRHEKLRTAKHKNAAQRAADAFVCGGIAGLVSRFLTAPFYRVADHAERHACTQQAAFKHIVAYQAGYLGLWQTQHPLLAAFWHTGAVFLLFEMGRRTADNLNIGNGPVENAVIGGTAAAIASAATFDWSRRRYTSCVLNESAILRGLGPTLAKEVPLWTVAFGLFTVLQPAVAPGYRNYGFGAWV